MNQMETKGKPKLFLITLLFLQLTFCVSILFDVPVARQVIGFFILTFFPGYIIIKILKLNELCRVETIVFSVGLSIAFLMITGLIVNELCPLIGISRPLSIMPLTITLNSFILIGSILVYLRSDGVQFSVFENLKLSPATLLLLVLPVLSIVGTMWVNVYDNNLILLATIIVISLLFGIGVVSKKLLSSELYPLAVFVVALALLYHVSLISTYLAHSGSDAFGEYFAFQLVERNSYWSTIKPFAGDFSVGRTYSMLSVTILPLVYSSLLNLNPMWVFKALNPLIFAFVPLGLYKLWSRFVGNKYAFISAFLFMSYQTFFTEMLGLSKQMIGELFLVLVLLVILNKSMKPLGKTLCFLIFSFALVASHYALAEILLFFITAALVLLLVMKRPSRNITITMIFFFFLIMFSWYIFTSSSSVFDSFLTFGQNVYNQLGDFFRFEARQEEVLRGLGLEAPPTIWNAVSRAFAYLTELFILIGFIGLVVKRKKIQVEKDYFIFVLISMGFLGALILVPGLASTMNMTRFYHILLFFIAPLFILGAEFISDLLYKRRNAVLTSILVLVVLVPYFLFQTGFVYEMTRTQSWSLPLSKYRMSDVRLYSQFGVVNAYCVFGAQWVSRNVAVENIHLYSDSWSRINELRGYGVVYVGYVEILSNTTEIMANGVVYLSPSDVVGGTVVGNSYTWNTSELQFLHDMDKIYSNGGSEVYKNEK